MFRRTRAHMHDPADDGVMGMSGRNADIAKPTRLTRCCRQGSPAALNSQSQLWARATNAASAAPKKMERRVSLFILRAPRKIAPTGDR
jgi:hypothetical protein